LTHAWPLGGHANPLPIESGKTRIIGIIELDVIAPARQPVPFDYGIWQAVI
jgi:hypothetical protein